MTMSARDDNPATPNRRLPALPATVVLLLSILLGVALGIVAAGDNVLAGDVPITRAVQRLDSPLFAVLADIGNAIGSTVGATIAIIIALGIALLRRARPEAIYLATLLVLRLLGTRLKPVFDSPRPTDDLVLIVGVSHGTGFPSGHAFTAATLALGLAVLAWRRIPSRRTAILVITLLVGLGLLVGWARIWSGAHWPSDVVGGYAFGTAIVAAGVIVLDRQDRRSTM